MFVSSIDVGIVNLGVIFVELDDITLQLIQIIYVDNVNSTVFEHNVVSHDNCTLGHMKTTTDRLMHFVQERQPMFDMCLHVLIERQPPLGHTDVEQILFFMFRDKAVLISPNAMHKFFKISNHSYENRKHQTVLIANAFLSIDQFPEYHNLERKHDIADAFCQLLFWVDMQHKRLETSKRPSPPPPLAMDAMDSGSPAINRFNQFIFKKNNQTTI